MNLIRTPDLAELIVRPYAGFVVDSVLFGTIAFFVALGCHAFRNRTSAADRHAIWFVALLVGVAGPLFRVSPQRPFSDRGPARQSPIAIVHARNSGELTAPARDRIEGSGSRKTPDAGARNSAWTGTSAGIAPLAGFELSAETMNAVAFTALAGTVSMLGLASARRLRTIRFRRSVHPVVDSAWEPLLEEARRHHRIRRRVRLVVHPDPIVPVTWGYSRPVVVVPRASENWSVERRRAVLLHELAHVRRWDCATQSFAELLRVAIWFHPLAWIAVLRMRVEREHACDDLVLESGTKPSDYAEHLLDLAKNPELIPLPGTIAMARPGHRLASRVTAILDPERRRRRAPVVLALVAGTLVLGAASPRPVALVRPTEEPGVRTKPKEASPPSERSAAAQSGITQLEKALEDSRAKVGKLQHELAKLREEFRIADLMPPGATPATEVESTSLAQLAELEMGVRSRMARERSKLSRLKNLPDDQLRDALLTLNLDDRILQHLGVLRATAEIDADVIRSTESASSPDAKAARERVRILNEKIAARVHGIIGGLEVQLAATEEELAYLQKEHESSRHTSVRRSSEFQAYFDKKRELENARLMQDVLIRKLAQERFDSEIPRGKVLPRPPDFPPVSVSPSP